MPNAVSTLNNPSAFRMFSPKGGAAQLSLVSAPRVALVLTRIQNCIITKNTTKYLNASYDLHFNINRNTVITVKIIFALMWTVG